MDAMHLSSRIDVPTLEINHCSDVSCPHPSCWQSRKLYKRNAYLLMLRGQPTNEIFHGEKKPDRRFVPQRDIPTQKVHNLVNELFRNASDADDWQPAAAARGISAGQLSIKHMPTPMSCLSRNASKLRKSECAEEEAEDGDSDGDEVAAGKTQRPVVGQVQMQDMFQPRGQHLVSQTRELVWVPNPNRKPRSVLRQSEQEVIGLVNINQELGHFLQEDNYNQRQVALQERAVERSHLSTARVQRFFKSIAPASSTKHVDLFKLPSDLLSEVLRNVDQGEPMTDESLARMVEQAEAPFPAGVTTTAVANVTVNSRQDMGDFERHVLRQRRAKLHNSEARLTRQPPPATRPVFLTDENAASPTGGKPRLPPISPKQQQKRIAGGVTVSITATVDDQPRRRQAKRSLGPGCQLMLGPVTPGPLGGIPEGSPSPPPLTPVTGGREDDGACSMDVECRSDRSTLLDEVLPIRMPVARDPGMATLLAMNRPSYDLDDPWADLADGPHTTTRNESMLMTSSSLSTSDVILNNGRRVQLTGSGKAPGISMPFSPLEPDYERDEGDGSSVNEEARDEGLQQQQQQQQLKAELEATDNIVAQPLLTGRGSPGPPPPSPDVESAGARRGSSPLPQEHHLAQAPLTQRVSGSNAKSAASSGQMPALAEHEETAEE